MTKNPSSLAGQIILRNRRKRRLNNKIWKAKAAISRAIKNGAEADQIRAMLISQNTILDSLAELNRRIG